MLSQTDGSALLRRSPRTEGRFRLFDSDDIQALTFIRKAQELGFSLNEIRELLILRAEHVPACSHVKELLDQKLASVQQETSELQNLVRSLKVAQRKCKRGLGTAMSGHEEPCPLLDEIGRAAQR
jgi:MerR family transcriptional regulator, Zn(II)-responsive regulator of zntA